MLDQKQGHPHNPRVACRVCLSSVAFLLSGDLGETKQRRVDNRMKRSRTCQCLQELDAPKRSRSTPDLGVLQRKNEVFGARVARNNYYEPATLGVDSALRLLLRTRPAGKREGRNVGVGVDVWYCGGWTRRRPAYKQCFRVVSRGGMLMFDI